MQVVYGCKPLLWHEVGGHSCQDATSLIARHLNSQGAHILNDIDNFGRVTITKEDAQSHFHHIQDILDDLGLVGAKHKASPPSQAMTWLGLSFDAVSISITIPPSKLADIATLVSDWKTQTHTNLLSLQALLGKLLHPPPSEFQKDLIGLPTSCQKTMVYSLSMRTTGRPSLVH